MLQVCNRNHKSLLLSFYNIDRNMAFRHICRLWRWKNSLQDLLCRDNSLKTDGHEFQILLLRKVMAGNGFLKSLGKKKSFVERRYPDGITWDQFQQEFTDRFFPQSHKEKKKIEEFFKLEQKNMSVSEYEKRFSELVRLVPYI